MIFMGAGLPGLQARQLGTHSPAADPAGPPRHHGC
jgi:hypothetical protein